MSCLGAGPVRVYGVGLCTPLGLTVEHTVAAWLDGTIAGHEPSFPTDGLPHRLVATVPGFNPRKQLPDRKAVKLMSREAQLLVHAAVEAVGVDAPDKLGVDPERFGAYAAAGYEVTPLDEVLEMFVAARDPDRPGQLSIPRLFIEGRAAYNPLSPLKTLPNMALFHAGLTLGLRGPHLSVGSSAAAGLAALQAGLDAIADGRADAAFVGATDAQVELYRLHYLAEMGALAGAIPGEGAGAVVLDGALAQPGDIVIGAVALAQEPVAGPDPREHYSVVSDGGAARAGVMQTVIDGAAAVGAPPVDLVFADLWGLPERDAIVRAATEQVVGDVRVLGSRLRFGQLGAAHGLVDVALAVALLRAGRASCALVTASGAAGDLGAAVLWRTS